MTEAATRFRYRAATAAGQLRSGVIDARSTADALVQLRRLGLVPIEASPTQAKAGSEAPARPSAAVRQAMINALGELSVLLGAGLTLDRALAISVENAQRPQLKAVLVRLHERVKQGEALSRALREAGPILPPLASAMAEAGEADGRLGPALARLAETLDRAEALRRTVVSSLIYPALLLVVAGGVIGVMLLFVVPQFETLFSDQSVRLPLATRMVIEASHLLRRFGPMAALAAVLAALGLRTALQQAGARRSIDRALLSTPGLGPLIAKAETARFARVLGSLVEGGVALPAALGIARRSLANSLLGEAVDTVAGALKQGGGLSGPLAAAGVFPPMAISFLRTGEETASLALMLQRLADVLERDVRTAVERLMGLLTPAVTLLMASLVGAIIASIISAILGFNDLALPS
jgi:general secretion pathway protein F